MSQELNRSVFWKAAVISARGAGTRGYGALDWLHAAAAAVRITSTCDISCKNRQTVIWDRAASKVHFA